MKEFTAWKEHFCRTKRRSMIDGSKIRGECFKRMVIEHGWGKPVKRHEFVTIAQYATLKLRGEIR